MGEKSDPFVFKVIPPYTSKEGDGEAIVTQDENVTLEDLGDAYFKVRNKCGKAYFVPISCLSVSPESNSKRYMLFLIHHPYSALRPDELTIRVGNIVTATTIASDGWCHGHLHGKGGWFPSNFGTPLTCSTFQSSSDKRLSTSVSSIQDNSYRNSIISNQHYSTLTKEEVAKILRPWEEYDWYFGKMTGAEGDRLLIEHGDVGDFLVRLRGDCTSLMISVLAKDKPHSFIIGIQKEYFIHGNRINRSLRKILDLYREHPIGHCADDTPIFLIKPLAKKT